MLRSKKKASRVVDEEFATVVGAPRSPSSRWGSVICAIVLAPFSCLSHPHINGPDGIWASAEMPQTSSELSHLMVRESLRYAILM
ncbi:hypothetical protein OROMI_008204 [Orobanche minor]